MRIAEFNYIPDKQQEPVKYKQTMHAKHALLTTIKKSRKLSLDQKNPEIVVSIGGDGTFLGAFHKYQDKVDSVHFVGFDTGHLGFYTDWAGNQLTEFLKSLQLHDNHKNVSYVLLQAKVHFVDGTIKTYLALNEAIVRRTNFSTLAVQLYTNNNKHPMETLKGDGFCVCTPTGSTASNKSLRGAILCPDLSSIQLTTIAPINSTEFPTLPNSMVISNRDKFTAYTQTDNKDAIIIDGHTICKPIKSITFTVSKHRIHFVKYHHIDFWDRVHNTFVENDRKKE